MTMGLWQMMPSTWGGSVTRPTCAGWISFCPSCHPGCVHNILVEAAFTGDITGRTQDALDSYARFVSNFPEGKPEAHEVLLAICVNSLSPQAMESHIAAELNNYASEDFTRSWEQTMQFIAGVTPDTMLEHIANNSDQFTSLINVEEATHGIADKSMSLLSDFLVPINARQAAGLMLLLLVSPAVEDAAIAKKLTDRLLPYMHTPEVREVIETAETTLNIQPTLEAGYRHRIPQIPEDMGTDPIVYNCPEQEAGMLLYATLLNTPELIPSAQPFFDPVEIADIIHNTKDLTVFPQMFCDIVEDSFFANTTGTLSQFAYPEISALLLRSCAATDPVLREIVWETRSTMAGVTIHEVLEAIQ